MLTSLTEEVANSTGQEVDKSRLTSQAFARAALITDVGIALATELETAGQKWSLGFPQIPARRPVQLQRAGQKL